MLKSRIRSCKLITVTSETLNRQVKHNLIFIGLPWLTAYLENLCFISWNFETSTRRMRDISRIKLCCSFNHWSLTRWTRKFGSFHSQFYTIACLNSFASSTKEITWIIDRVPPKTERIISRREVANHRMANVKLASTWLTNEQAGKYLTTNDESPTVKSMYLRMLNVQ